MAQPAAETDREVVVVKGAGGVGMVVARRVGGGRTLCLADASRGRLDVRRRVVVAGAACRETRAACPKEAVHGATPA
ncbi:hypothetical protein [Streptomyces sp. NPDC005538]|uniref:hypothetical protein n=1 Tax=unclassified Streptomyces TaxID=2593676 RepID=UPI0033ACF394